MAVQPIDNILTNLTHDLETVIKDELRSLLGNRKRQNWDAERDSMSHKIKRLEDEKLELLKLSTEEKKRNENLIAELKKTQIQNHDVIARKKVELEEQKTELKKQALLFDQNLDKLSAENDERLEKCKKDLQEKYVKENKLSVEKAKKVIRQEMEEEFKQNWTTMKSSLLEHHNNLKVLKEDFSQRLNKCQKDYTKDIDDKNEKIRSLEGRAEELVAKELQWIKIIEQMKTELAEQRRLYEREKNIHQERIARFAVELKTLREENIKLKTGTENEQLTIDNRSSNQEQSKSTAAEVS